MKREPLRLQAVIALLVAAATVAHAGQSQSLIPAVRQAVAQQDFARGEKLIDAYRAGEGVTPVMLEALSWLGRGALAAKQWDNAEAYAQEAYDLSLTALKGRTMDQERHLPIALGAAIEVLAHARAARGARSEAVHVLNQELRKYSDTSLAKRIKKNIHLLSLEGQAAPAIDVSDHLGAAPPALDALKGKVVVLFFWAHWCGDCKTQGPILGRLLAKYGQHGVTVLAPTQRYGYVAGGQTASPEEEARYINQIRETQYDFLKGQPIPLSAANHQRYGVSTTPTLVLLDRDGIVRLYHPGRMSEEELDPLLRRLSGVSATSSDSQ